MAAAQSSRNEAIVRQSRDAAGSGCRDSRSSGLESDTSHAPGSAGRWSLTLRSSCTVGAGVVGGRSDSGAAQVPAGSAPCEFSASDRTLRSRLRVMTYPVRPAFITTFSLPVLTGLISPGSVALQSLTEWGRSVGHDVNAVDPVGGSTPHVLGFPDPYHLPRRSRGHLVSVTQAGLSK